ncbi:hypothetical protein VTN02DRAFT_2263 [Thermoascus thermophilus]
MPPPALSQGGGAPDEGPMAKAMREHLAEEARRTKIKHDVFCKFGDVVDHFVASQKQPEAKSFAQEIAEKVLFFLSVANYVDTGGADYYPVRARSNPTTVTSSQSVSWADIARTPKNPGAGVLPNENARAQPAASRNPLSARSGPTIFSTQQDDRRVLIALGTQERLNRLEPYAVRQVLAKHVDGLTTATAIPKVEPTATGWAVTAADTATRDLLLAAEKQICDALGATSVRLPQKWYNYAVPGVPYSIRELDGSFMETAPLVEAEAEAQTRAKPIYCRPSRHGVNPVTRKTTWIISFLHPVGRFTLFNASEASRLIKKKAPISRHDPGCQGYCIPARCTRVPRCSRCSERLDSHEGPSGAQCTRKARCANCYGPYPAGHGSCPAAPRRRNGAVHRLSKKELDKVRRYGNQCYRDTYAHSREQQVKPRPAPSVGAEPTPRKRDHNGAPASNSGWQQVR